VIVAHTSDRFERQLVLKELTASGEWVFDRPEDPAVSQIKVTGQLGIVVNRERDNVVDRSLERLDLVRDLCPSPGLDSLLAHVS
jgi:hypothetical protein